MNSAQHFVAFDLGAESGRVILGALEGRRLTLHEKHRFPTRSARVRGHYHWDILAQWEELKAGLRKVAADAAGKLDIAGIGVDTWGVDFGLIDRNGELLGNPFMYRDGRTLGVMEGAFAKVPREEMFDATGIQFLQFNSLFQLLAFAQADRGVLDSAETLLFIPDLFNFFFTGRRASEYSIASTSQMLDMHTGKWALAMMEKLGLPVRILPEVVAPATVLGPLEDDVARECGIGRVPVIAPGCHDTASAVAAVPVAPGAEDWCYISSGTWSLVGAEADKPVITAAAMRFNCTNEGGVGGKIRLLKNVMGLWLVQECRRQWQREGSDLEYARLVELAAAARPFSAVINPDYGPFLSPGDMPGKIAQFCAQSGQSAPAGPGEIVRTCLESLALAYRRTIEQLESLLGRRLSTIHIVGGGSQNALLNQMTADACGRTVIAGPVEATAAGNILTQALAVGALGSLTEVRQVVRESFGVTRFEPRGGGEWEAPCRRLRDLVGE